MKYDKMVAINQEKNREKIEIAKRAIGEMLNRKERISVTSLSRNTGFAKSFFYRNKEVRMTLDNALLQQGECYNPKKVIFDLAMQETNKNLKISIMKLKQVNIQLQAENENLKEQVKELQKQISELKK